MGSRSQPEEPHETHKSFCPLNKKGAIDLLISADRINPCSAIYDNIEIIIMRIYLKTLIVVVTNGSMSLDNFQDLI
jgi:hypothetical protein